MSQPQGSPNTGLMERQTSYVLASACGALAMGTGVVAILGWIFEVPFLSTFASGRMPMAPGEALLSVLYGAAILLRCRLPMRRPAYWAAVAINAVGGLVAVLLFCLSSLGIRLAAEHLGLPITAVVHGSPVGYMSPVTAICFLVASLSFLASSSATHRRVRAIAAWWLACLLVAASLVLLLAYLYGTPLLYGGPVLPPPVTTSLSFGALGIALLILSVKQIQARGEHSEADMRLRYALGAVFIVVAAGIAIAGYLYYHHYERRHRDEVERQLLAVAELKTDELMDWREERLGDASVLFGNPAFSALVRRYVDDPQDVEAQRQLLAWLGQFQARPSYDRVSLLDASGAERLAVPDRPEPVAARQAGDAAEALRSGKVTFLDFHRDGPDRPVRLAILVPVLDNQDGRRPLGVLVLRIDPAAYLYPFINRWPTPSQTAETLIVRRDGEEALFLNELRFQKNTALMLRSPLTNTEQPAVMAVLGQEGIVEGVDYRGVPVIAAVRAVRGSPWFLVARMDTSEVYAPARERWWLMMVLVGVLLLAAGAGVGLIWRQQRIRFYRERYQAAEALRESEERSRTTLYSIGDAVITTDAEGRVRQMNPVAERLTGWGEAEALGQPLEQVFHIVNEETRAEVESPVKHVLREGAIIGLANHTLLITRDGRERPIADSGAPIRNSKGEMTGVVLVFRDVTASRQLEEERETTIQMLGLLNAKNNFRELMQSATAFLHARIGCDAVGIRLRQGDDFPYFQTRGFPQEFVEAENYLCVRDLDGQVRRDEMGNPALECMCGNVLCRRFDPAKPFFTANGSFWTNCTTDLLAGITEADRQGRTRNRCNGEGYESVALIPLRAGKETLGLLQLNDRRKGRFTVEEIALLERLSHNLVIALMQRRAEAALRESEARLRTTLYSIGDAVITTDTSGRVRQMNPVGESLTGWLETEALGKPLAEVFRIVNEETRSEVESPVERVLREGMVVGLANHTLLISRDGRERPIADSGAPIRDENGEITGVVLVFRDQTEERAAQRALQVERDNLRAIMSASPVGILVLDQTEQVADANPAAEHMFGRRLSELKSRRCGDVIGCVNRREDPRGCGHSSQCPDCRLYTAIRSVLSGGPGIHDQDVKVQTESEKGPRSVWFTFSIEPALLHGRRHAVVALNDISDRKAAEESLRESEARYRTLVENINLGISLIGPDNRVLATNAAQARLSDRPIGELVGKPCFQAFRREDDICPDCPGRQAAATGRPAEVEYTGYRSDGTVFAARLRVFPLPASGGRGEGFIEVVEDITERRKLEGQLLQSQKMEAIGQLAGGIAHDFRNQLTVIKGFGDMILRRSLVTDKGQDMLREILKAAERSALLTGQLLAFSRKQTFDLQQVDLTDLITDACKAIPRIVGEDVRLHIQPCATRCVVEIDPGQFQQALINLVANACDAMPKGGELTMTTSLVPQDEAFRKKHPDAGPGAYGAVTVSDTGCGMDEATQAKLFEPFFTTKPPGQGTGLGLSMVYGFVKQSGGLVEVESQPGQGSTFRLCFPLVESAGQTPGSREDTAEPPRGQENLLLVEDEPAVRRMLSDSLRESGYVVTEAGNATEALGLLDRSESGIDMLVTDVVMPGGSGVDLAQRISEARPNLPVLYLSGYAGKELSKRGVTLDPRHVLTKPVSYAAFLRKVRELLDEAGESSARNAP